MAIRTPIIPQSITVHLGAPDDNKVKNIIVPFPEYIKNVASGEIYPNWPLEAVIANILAQISFALNRVYNEWYPAKGYNFDITSDPRYDQSFSEDREFFERISQIVDEIFNNYLVEVGQVQPLFATYCDGIKTTCKGLSQWGSVDLANKGKSAIEIIRYYYGNNINIIYNAPIEAIEETYPGTILKLGDSADTVKLLKVELNRIGQNYPAIPSIIDDSVFYTLDTYEAVKKFQEIFSLPTTGQVDKATWYKIKYIYNAVKHISDLYSEGISVDEVELSYKEAKIGDSGSQIRALNYLLNVIAFFNHNIPYLNLHGSVFNSYTKQVVLAFQKEYGLEESGIVREREWLLLNDIYKQTLKNIPKEYMTHLNEFYPGVLLVPGLTGENVLNLQRFLYVICNNTHSIPGVIINGEYDELTEASIKSIQRLTGLDVTGIVGPATWYQIVELAKK